LKFYIPTATVFLTPLQFKNLTSEQKNHIVEIELVPAVLGTNSFGGFNVTFDSV
jgi:hypothetical protein